MDEKKTGGDLHLRKKGKKIRVQAMLDPEVFDMLQRTAEENDASLSEVAAQIITKYYS